MNINKVYTGQISKNDCGPASISMICKYFGGYYSLEYIYKLCNLNKNRGINLLEVKNATKKLGLNSRVIKSDKKIFDKKTPTPFIIHLNLEKTDHYCVVFDIKDDKILVADPDTYKGIKWVIIDEIIKYWSGICVFFEPNENFIKHSKIGSNYLEVIKNNRVTIVMLLFVSIIITLIGMAGAMYLQLAIDYYIPSENKNLLLSGAIIVILMYIVSVFLRYYRDLSTVMFSQKISKNITLNYINHIINLPMNIYSYINTGDFLTRINDITVLTDALSASIVTIFLDIIMITISIGFLFNQNIILSTIVLTSLPLYIFVIYKLSKKFLEVNYDVMEKNNILQSTIVDSMENIEVVKSFSSEGKIFSKIETYYNIFLGSAIKFTKVIFIQDAEKTMIELTYSVLIICLGSILVMNKLLTIGQLITFIAIFTFLTNSIKSVLLIQPKLQTALVAHRRIDEILQISKEDVEESNTIIQEEVASKISVRNLNYSINSKTSILNNISLEIEGGKKIAIIGKSGSGKTTLMKAIVKFVDKSYLTGDILINNQSIFSIDGKKLRNHICYVPQNSNVISGSILDNLTFGISGEVNEFDIYKKLETVGMHDVISQLPDKLDTLINRTSTFLSAGQKQRLIIARALLSDAKIIIFDESTSNIDQETEEKIIKKIFKDKRTILVVTHRESIPIIADETILIARGKVISQGNQKYLSENSDEYKKLFTY